MKRSASEPGLRFIISVFIQALSNVFLESFFFQTVLTSVSLEVSEQRVN